MWLYICVSARCGCLHRRACVWECQCPHRWGGGVFGVAEGSVGAFGPQFFWLHGWSMISFLGKPCPVGRSGGMVWVWKLKIEASCGGTNHLNAMEQTWPTDCSSIWDTLPWWRSNLFPFDLLLLHYKKLSKPPPPLHYNAGIIFMNERARWSVISLHPQPRTLNEFINEKSGERNLQDMKNRMHSTRRAEWLESVN